MTRYSLLALSFFVVAFSAGCARYSSYGYVLPPGSALRTDGVYVCTVHGAMINGDTIPTRYAFIRFFASGQCYKSDAYLAYPTSKELVSISDSGYAKTYYRVEGDDIVVQAWVGFQRKEYIYQVRSDSLMVIGELVSCLFGLIESRRLSPRIIDAAIYHFVKTEETVEPNW